MSLINTDNISIQSILANGLPPSPPKKDDSYRYYHCRHNYTGLKCKQVDSPSVLPSEGNTKLLFVKSYLPERLDKYILKYKWIPDTVIIEKKST